MSDLSDFLSIYNAIIGTVSVIQQSNIAQELREQKRNELRYQLERARTQHQLDRILVNNSRGNRVILLETVVARDIETVDMLLTQFNANPNVKDINGNTALHAAVSYGDYYIAQLLISYGADVNSVNAQGNTPMHIAAAHGFTNIVSLLLRNGSDINSCNYNGETPLFLSAKNNNYSMVNNLIRYGADINTQDSNGNSILHIAATRNNSSMLKLLLKYNADVNIANNNCRTPLHLAVVNNKPYNIKALLSSELLNINTQDDSGRTALHYALAQSDAAKMLVNYGADINITDNDGNTPLHLAATYNRKDSIKLLLSRSALVNVSNNKGELPIHLAIRTRNTEIVKLLLHSGASLLDETLDHDIALFIPIKHSDYQMVKNLVQSFYVNVNTVNSVGVCPLHVAIDTGNLAMIKLLIELGANVNIRYANGSTPIHYAVSRGNYSIVKLLLKYGANVNIQDQDDNTPLHIAINSNFANITQLLRQSGANIYIENKNHIRSSHDRHSSLSSSNNIDMIGDMYNKSYAIKNRHTANCSRDINKIKIQVYSTPSTSLNHYYMVGMELASSYASYVNKKGGIVSRQHTQSIDNSRQLLLHQHLTMYDLSHRVVHQMADYSLVSTIINFLMVIVSLFK